MTLNIFFGRIVILMNRSGSASAGIAFIGRLFLDIISFSNRYETTHNTGVINNNTVAVNEAL